MIGLLALLQLLVVVQSAQRPLSPDSYSFFDRAENSNHNQNNDPAMQQSANPNPGYEPPRFSQVSNRQGHKVVDYITASEGSEAAGRGQIDVALAEIKDDIVLQATDLKHELDWIKQVDDLLSSYQVKRDKVAQDVELLRLKIRNDLKKKRQVENLKLQKQLGEQLKVAESQLGSLDTAIRRVSDKHSGFARSRDDVDATVKRLGDALAELKGGATAPEEAKRAM